MMKEMKRRLTSAVKRLWGLPLRYKLLLYYIPLTGITIIIAGLIYYNIITDTIMDGSSSDLYNLVKKGNEIIDNEFEYISSGITWMHIDEDLFDSFQEIDPNDQFDIIYKDKTITKVLQRYIPKLENIYSMNFVTSYYTFGRNAMYYIPRAGFSGSYLYEVGKDSPYKVQWIPTFDFFSLLDKNERSMIKWDRHYVFSAVKLFNPSMTENRNLVNMDINKEHPVLIINFKEEIFKEVFESHLTIPDSYYFVAAKDKRFISHPNAAKIGTNENSEWMSKILSQKNGKGFYYINGKKMLVCFDTSAITGWTAGVVIPYERLFSSLPAVRNIIIYTCLALIVLSVLLAYVISVRVTKPIYGLMAAIKRLGQGKEQKSLEGDSKDEIRYITHKFSEMNNDNMRLIEENYDIKIKQKQAQLMALKLQFNPHFLYNTLNSINMKAIENGNKTVGNMIVSLSNMFRYTIEGIDDQVEFGEDLKRLKDYIYIMSERMEGKFSVEYDFDIELYRFKVPKFFLQPFVENSIIHGFEEMSESGLLKLSGWVESEKRYFVVEDNGKGFDYDMIKSKEAGFKREGIGIRNIDNQIKLLFGDEYGIEIISVPEQGTTVTIVMGMYQKPQ